MKHKIQVVMLPTEDRTSKIWFDNDTKKFILFDTIGVMNCTSQHLYITISPDVEPIKEGDWYLNKYNRVSIRVTGKKAKETDRKIISTTNPKLLKEHDDSVPIPRMRDTGIAQLQQSFIREFVVNPDGEWEVEYVYDVDILDEYNKEVDYTGSSCIDLQDGLELKLNKDSTVNITSVKEKMYSKEEMYLSAANVVNEIAANRGNSNWNMKVTPKMIVDDWIKETL
tara:strand:+ start:442 stop:1116 length:675 start_codon:yes stop_codon:yes gene_type:complete